MHPLFHWDVEPFENVGKFELTSRNVQMLRHTVQNKVVPTYLCKRVLPFMS